MNQWFYARGGQQSGPVTLEELRQLAISGGISVSDLVWNSSMKDWQPAGSVPGIFGEPVSAVSTGYDASAPLPAGESLPEIVPGSEPIDIMACIKRGFTLTARHFGIIFATLLILSLINMAVSVPSNLLRQKNLRESNIALQAQSGEVASPADPAAVPDPTAPPSGLQNPTFDARDLLAAYRGYTGLEAFLAIVSQIVSLFLTLGAIRIFLDLASGKEVSLGMLFGEGKKLISAFLASWVFGFACMIGFLLLIVPGVYIALRYGMFFLAIVDKNLGVKDSFSYSSSITTNNRLNLLGLFLMCFLIMIAGLLACFVGMIFAAPVVYLTYAVAYRWMQYGHRATLDHPGTKTPMLR